MNVLLLGSLGLLVGAAVGWWLLRRAIAERAQVGLERWRLEAADRIARDAAERVRLATKVDYQPDAGLVLPALAADTRFLGDPVHLVAFDGDSEVKARTGDVIRAVRFASIGHAPDADLVEECVAAGRVRWQTLRVAADHPDPEPDA